MPEIPKEWTVLSMINWGTAWFRKKKIPSPRLSIEWLLADVLQTQRLNLYLQYDRPLSSAELAVLRKHVRRRARHEPLQYIIGYTDFMHVRLHVTPHVLIPRPETERLAELILEQMPPVPPLTLLDVGTGSGCIAISLKKERPDWDIHALDCSEPALELARKNADLNGTEVHFLKGDFFERATFQEDLTQQLDVIVSNPPYIPDSERLSVEPEVRDFEPEIALFTGDLMKVYRALKAMGEQSLKKEGFLFLEIHEDFGDELLELFQPPIWKSTLHKDYNGKNRIISALYKG